MSYTIDQDGFYDANRARQIALGMASGNSDVLLEINTLRLQIDGAAAGGEISVDIEALTTMTNSEDFFNAWNDPYHFDTPADKLMRIKMDMVIKYFTRLGYYIRRERVGVTSYFKWVIQW